MTFQALKSPLTAIMHCELLTWQLAEQDIWLSHLRLHHKLQHLEQGSSIKWAEVPHCAKISFQFFFCFCFWEALKCYMWHSCHHLRKPDLKGSCDIETQKIINGDYCYWNTRIYESLNYSIFLVWLFQVVRLYQAISLQVLWQNCNLQCKWKLKQVNYVVFCGVSTA